MGGGPHRSGGRNRLASSQLQVVRAGDDERTLMRHLLLLVSSVIHGGTAHGPIAQTESPKSMFVEIVQRCVYCVRLHAHAMPKIHETIYQIFRSAITHRIRSGHIERLSLRRGF